MNRYELHDFYQRRADAIYSRYKTTCTIVFGLFFGGSWSLAQLIALTTTQTLDVAIFLLATMFLLGGYQRHRVDKMLRLNAKDHACDHQTQFPGQPRTPFFGIDAGSFVNVTTGEVTDAPAQQQPLPPPKDRGITAFVTCLIYVAGIWVLAAIPTYGLLIVLRWGAVESQDVVFLSPFGRCALFAVALAMFGGSLLVGGFVRAFMRPELVGKLWLVGVGCALFLALPYLSDAIRRMVTSLGHWDQGDNATVGAFLAFWILMVGYAAKTLWDELRDRLSAALPGCWGRIRTYTMRWRRWCCRSGVADGGHESTP